MKESFFHFHLSSLLVFGDFLIISGIAECYLYYFFLNTLEIEITLNRQRSETSKNKQEKKEKKAAVNEDLCITVY